MLLKGKGNTKFVYNFCNCSIPIIIKKNSSYGIISLPFKEKTFALRKHIIVKLPTKHEARSVFPAVGNLSNENKKEVLIYYFRIFLK